MKVLFAINTESNIKQIVEFYKNMYGEKLETTNVYFFKSLLDTLKKNKDFDRIIIHEELEPISNKNQDVIDNYIFKNVDNITDESGNAEIIFICGENRGRNDKLLSKMFNIGIYNILIGEERTIGKVCELINKPRTKKDAKRFLEVDVEGVTYEDPSKVDEVELRNIIKWYEKNSNDREKILYGFEEIYEQYTLDKLKVIIGFLPVKARDVLAAESEKYMAIMGYDPTQNRTAIKYVTEEPRQVMKYAEVPVYITEEKKEPPKMEPPKMEPPKIEPPKVKPPKIEPVVINEVEPPKVKSEPIKPEPVRVEPPKVEPVKVEPPKVEPVRVEPPKVEPEPVRVEPPKVEPVKVEPPKVEPVKVEPPKVEPVKVEPPKVEPVRVEPPKVEPVKVEPPQPEPVRVAPPQPEPVRVEPQVSQPVEPVRVAPPTREPVRVAPPSREPQIQTVTQVIEREVIKEVYETPRDYQKSVCFIGAHKAGTTFIINAIATSLVSRGVKVAILDLTQNKDTYMIYAANDSDNKDVAGNSIPNLALGQDLPLKLGDLSIYTGVPRADRTKLDCLKVLEMIRRKNSVVLIDCDFTTPVDIFRLVNNVFVIQDMDVLNILPITMFLKELKVREVDLSKVEVIVNKYMKSVLTVSKIVEAVSYYTNPEMTFYDDLLDKHVKRFIIPFDEQNYLRYLESIYSSKMNFASYSEEFKQALAVLIQDIFPINMNVKGYSQGTSKKGGFFGKR